MAGLATWAVVAISAAVLLGVTTSKADRESAMQVRIEPTGGAVFLLADVGGFRHGWTVSCPMPLRGCVARSPGIVVRLDEESRPWLAIAASRQAQLSVLDGQSSTDATALLSSSMDADMLALLTRDGGRLLVKEPGQGTSALQTEGLDSVVKYLAWLQSPGARGLRDARLWPDGGSMNLQDASPVSLETYRVLGLRAAESQRRAQDRVYATW